MATVQKADIGMFDDIHALLEDFHNPRLGPDDWRRLFLHHWNSEDDSSGYVLVRNASIVGFLGTIFSQRYIEGRLEHFCNVSSWIVKPEVRAEGIKLLLPLLGLRGCTVTNLSPSHTVCRIFEQLGFRYMDVEARIFYPPPHLFRLRPTSGFSVLTDVDAIAREIDDGDRRILQDHRRYRCGHVLLRRAAGGRYCYCIYTTIIRNSFRFSHIQHISDTAVFLDAIDVIGDALFSERNTLFMKVDSRLLGNRAVPHSFRFTVTSPRMYKSESLRPDQVDNLYSELILLNL